jgi:hypothetical protein
MSASFGRLVVRISFACAVFAFVPSLALAQVQDRSVQSSITSTFRDAIRFLSPAPAVGAAVFDATPQAAPPPPQAALPPEEQGGITLGVKGGLIFASLGNVDPFNNPISHSLGTTFGVFVGSNPARTWTVVAELLYNRRSAEQTDNPANKLDLYSLEIPMLIRYNIGSPNPKTVRFYLVGGAAADLQLKSQLAGQDISENYQGFNINAIGGGGADIAHFLIEVRGDWGLRSMTNGNFANQATIYQKTVVGLIGYRFR